MKVEGFEKWFEFVLLKIIGAGMTAIMDNTSFHRKKELTGISAKANRVV